MYADVDSLNFSAGGSIAMELRDADQSARFYDEVQIDGGLNHQGATIGFFSTGLTAKQTVLGSRATGVALTNLLIALDNYGLITDSTTL